MRKGVEKDALLELRFWRRVVRRRAHRIVAYRAAGPALSFVLPTQASFVIGPLATGLQRRRRLAQG